MPEKQKPKEAIAPKAKPEDESDHESEEEEGEPVRRPRTSAIIGFRTIQATGAGKSCFWKLPNSF